MLKLTPEKVIEKIKKGIPFEAKLFDESLYFKIDEYTPFICTAIHQGSQLSEDLKEKILFSEKERYYEEDPYTGDFIISLPIVIMGCDSRFEYDLNRNHKNAIYDIAWGKKVWKTKLTGNEISKSLLKHSIFYKILDALVEKLEKAYGACVVYDIHSYNYKRLEYDSPTFNIGTGNLDKKKYDLNIKNWIKQLSGFNLPNIDVRVSENEVFQGNGYLLHHLMKNFKNTLVLSTEIKKIYYDEENGDSYPIVIDALKENFKRAIINNSINFAKKFTKLKVIKKNIFLSSELDDTILKIDKALFHIVKKFEILGTINPINIEQEKRRFFHSRYKTNPQFKYKQLNINPYELKKKLFSIPVEKIRDISVQELYKDSINSYGDKIELLTTIGTQNFLYNSLRYYGEPSLKDISNAEFILYAPEINMEKEEVVTAAYAKEIFQKICDLYDFKCKISFTNKIVAKILTLKKAQSVLIRKDANFLTSNVLGLANHEIGVHMLTTFNAKLQPLKIFWLGLPNNTHTQEGLAVLSEYLSGNISSMRLKEIALRVICVHLMLKGYEFKKTFQYLIEEYKLDQNSAYYLAARIYRGGGFTKDYLYLKGFRDLLEYFHNGHHILNLLIGKTSLSYIRVINEMIERKWLLPPKYKTIPFIEPINNNPIINYLIKGIK